MNKILTQYYGSAFSLLVLLFLVSALLVLKPELDGVKTTNAQITTSLQALEGERVYFNSLEQSINAAQTISPDVLEQVDHALPRAQKVPELLVLFQSASERGGVSIKNLNFSEMAVGNKNESSISEVSINLSVGADSYPQIKRFIRDLEASLRLLDITGVNVAMQGKESVYALQMKTYVYAPAAKAAATSTTR